MISLLWLLKRFAHFFERGRKKNSNGETLNGHGAWSSLGWIDAPRHVEGGYLSRDSPLSTDVRAKTLRSDPSKNQILFFVRSFEFVFLLLLLLL